MTVLPLYRYPLAPHSSPQHNYSQFIYSKHSHLRIAAVLFLWESPKVVVCALTFVWLGFNRFCGFATAKVVVSL